MTRVLVLIKGLGRGGAEQLAVGSLRHLDPDRTECEVAYLLPWKDALVDDVRTMGIEVHCLGSDTRWPGNLRALVKKRRFDVVHSHSPVPASAARVVAARTARHLYTEHNVWQRYRTPTRVANELTFPRNAHVLAVSESVARSIQVPRLADRFMPPMETLYHGVDAGRLRAHADAGGGPSVREELGLAQETPLVSVVANFKPHKGLDVLIRAARVVVNELPDVRFLLMGVGGLEDELKGQIERSGLREHVRLLGFREDVPRILAASNVFALSSLQEGLPISLLEAMALGVPPVVTAVGGCPEVVTDGLDGRLVRPADAAGLAAALLGVLDDPDLAERLAENARRRSDAFDLSVAAHRIQELYEEVAA